MQDKRLGWPWNGAIVLVLSEAVLVLVLDWFSIPFEDDDEDEDDLSRTDKNSIYQRRE